MRSLTVESQVWPIRGTFSISRGSKTAADVVVVELTDQGHRGWGECVPYARYGETTDSVISQIESIRPALQSGIDHHQLQSLLPAGAARNAVDCALWDIEAAIAGRPVWALADLDEPVAVTTAYTLSLDDPAAMQAAARARISYPLLKLKLAGEGDIERVHAVRTGAPQAKLIVDANEGWTLEQYRQMVPQLVQLGVSVIEQPLPADADEQLLQVARPIPLCADESCHDSSTLDRLIGRYDMVNIKLDKTGGLTEALALRTAAVRAGFEVMVGCMLATSLSMAPAVLVAQGAGVVDLDGPLLLVRDREHGLVYDNAQVAAPTAQLWG